MSGGDYQRFAYTYRRVKFSDWNEYLKIWGDINDVS